VSRDIPLLVNEFEILLKFLPASISLFEGPFLPQLLVEELVDWGVAVYSRTGVAIPIPDASIAGALFVDLDLVPKLTKSAYVRRAPGEKRRTNLLRTA
jgi:hypothetical protein